MAYGEGPLLTAEQVEAAVLSVEPNEMQLARGAGLLADRNGYRIHGPNGQRTYPSMGLVLGVTVLSMDSDDNVSFRTVTFGNKDPQGDVQMDAVGPEAIISSGAFMDNDEFVNLANKYGPGAAISAFEIYQRDGVCTLGGVAIVYDSATSVEGEIDAEIRRFVAEDLADNLQSKVSARIGLTELEEAERLSRKQKKYLSMLNNAGYDVPEAIMLSAYFDMIANASRRDDVVSVPQAFIAEI